MGLALVAVLGLGDAARAETKDKRIALANNYSESPWRQAMLQSWSDVTRLAVAGGVVAAADTYSTSLNQPSEQATIVKNLILQGYHAIVINAASPDSLGDVIKQACTAGVVVVSFDGIVNEPCAWRLSIDYKRLGQIQLDYLASRFPKGGNILEIRGIAGIAVDDAIHRGILQGLSARGQFNVVASVHGNWSEVVAQKAVAGVLPTLPDITAVVTQSGDGAGVARAFKEANRPPPPIILSNRREELDWWKEQRDANGYQTMSVSVAPGVVTMAFWVAQMILDGKQVPKDLTLPFLQINQADLDKVLAATEAGGIANVEYTAEDAARLVGGGQ